MKDALPLHFGAASSPYITSENHKYLHDDWLKAGGPNIGADGVNLTITFLTMNRSSLSIRLCESIVKWIPAFAGEIVIIDNGSIDEEQRRMTAYLKDFPFKWRRECLGRNYGVAGGRNRTIPFIRTEWLMSLDNDIYLISNPLKQLQADLARLGCHFLTLPVLNEDERTNFHRGGHLYLEEHGDELYIGGGSAAKTDPNFAEGEGFLATFLTGTASVYRKDSFLRLGGFDEGRFVGFEDTEFSLRLFREGMKVGASDMRAFVHAHVAPESNADVDYEKVRFSRQRILEAARYFERKHGYKVWRDGVSEWIAQRETELGIEAEAADEALVAAPNPHPRGDKPRIALIVDLPNWALANIAYQLEKWLSDEFEIFVFAMSECDHNAPLAAYMTRSYDLVHFFWREALRLIFSDVCADGVDHYFGSRTEMRRAMSQRPTTISVYDHLFLSHEDLEARLSLFNEFSAGYTVSSNRLLNIYKNIAGYPQPAALTPDGVDLERFQPAKLERFDTPDRRPLRVGWVGNSGWAEDILDDPKGFSSILVPALERLKQEGAEVQGVFADRKVAFTPHHRMPDYYSKIDVLICASTIEGTPNPVLEAMACGVPVVSTDVGIVPEAFGPLQKAFILPKRDINSMYAALNRLNSERQLLQQLSAENLEQIRHWDWRARAEAFRNFFRHMLDSPRR